MYFHTLTNWDSARALPFLSEITYSDFDFSFASFKHSTSLPGIGMSLLAAGVFNSVEITGRLFTERHARRTEIYGVAPSRKTQSHRSARISSRRNPAYNPIITKTYGGNPLIVSRRIFTCSSVNAFFSCFGVPPFAESDAAGL